MKTSYLAASIAAVLMMFTASQLGAQTYSFKKIAEGVFPDSFNDAVMNAGGTVAFTGQISGNYGLFIGNTVPLTQVSYSGPVQPRNLGGSMDVSDNGEFAFYGITGLSTGHGIYKVSGATATELTAGTGLVAFNTPPSINGNGMVAFSTSAMPPGASHIYTSDGVTRTPIVDTTGPFSDFRDVMIIDSGAIVFEASLDANISSGVYLAQGGTVTTIANNASGQFLGARDPSINNAGDIAFIGFTAGGNSSLYLSRGGVITPYDLDSISYVGGTHINSSGSVAFVGAFPQNGIYTTHETGVYEVISVGDPLFGSTLSTLAFNHGYSDNGQVAFRYELADGRRGIAVGTPVPEPAGALLLGLALAILPCRRTRA
jgi:hypothetical protein